MVVLEYPFYCRDGRIINRLVDRNSPIPDIYLLLLTIPEKNYRFYDQTIVDLVIKYFDFNGNTPEKVKKYKLEVNKEDEDFVFNVYLMSHDTYFDEYIKKTYHFVWSRSLSTSEITICDETITILSDDIYEILPDYTFNV